MKKNKRVMDYIRSSNLPKIDAAVQSADQLLEAELADIQRLAETATETDAVQFRVRALVLRELADTRIRRQLLRRMVCTARQLLPSRTTSRRQSETVLALLD